MSDEQTVRARLDALIRARGEDYLTISKLLGRNPAYVQQFIKRGVPRRLAEEDRRRLAAHFGVAERLLGGPPEGYGHAVVAGEAAARAADDYVLIPKYDVSASAGDGALPDDESAETALAFQARWARQIASGSVDALAVIRVEGDSMYPTLADGDHILVDTHDKERLREGIYVVRIAGALHVKRLSLHPARKRLAIKSDNPAYPSWTDIAPEDVDVIGRVVWVGRRL